MAYIILPSRRKRPDLFELDHSHPLAQGLVFFPWSWRHMGRVSNIVSNRSATLFTAVWKNQAFVSTFLPKMCTWEEHLVEGTGDFTFCVRTDQSSKYNFTPILGQSSKSGKFTGIKLNSYYNSNAQQSRCFSFTVNDSEGATKYDVLPSVSASEVLGFSTHYGGMRKAGNYSLYINGNEIEPTIATHGTASPLLVDDLSPTGHGLGILYYSTSTINNMMSAGASIYDAQVYNRALSPAEIALLADRTDPMLAGLIRDKKPAPKYWYMRQPDDFKIKTVTPVVLKHDWMRQPQGAVAIDQDWASRGFIFADIPSVSRPIIPVSVVSTYSKAVHRAGVGISPDSDSSALDIGYDSRICNFSGDCTIIVSLTKLQNAGVGWPSIFRTLLPNVSESKRGGIAFNNINSNVYVYFRSAANNSWQETSGHPHPVGQTRTWVAWKNGLVLSIASNGVLHQQVSISSHGASDLSNNTFGYFGHYDSQRNPRYILHFAACSTKSVTVNDALNLSRNPYQILQPIKRRIYAYNSTFDLRGAQDGNNINFEWGK